MTNPLSSLSGEPPPLADLEERLKHLEHQSTTVLFLSAVNLIANAVTVVIAVLALAS